jgi:hypothetical protein
MPWDIAFADTVPAMSPPPLPVANALAAGPPVAAPASLNTPPFITLARSRKKEEPHEMTLEGFSVNWMATQFRSRFFSSPFETLFIKFLSSGEVLTGAQKIPNHVFSREIVIYL